MFNFNINCWTHDIAKKIQNVMNSSLASLPSPPQNFKKSLNREITYGHMNYIILRN